MAVVGGRCFGRGVIALAIVAISTLRVVANEIGTHEFVTHEVEELEPHEHASPEDESSEHGHEREHGHMESPEHESLGHEASEHGGGHKHEHIVTPVNAGMSVMLIGSIGFVMVLYELTHWTDPPSVKKYTWQVLSATISIFSSVLIFQATHGILEKYVLERYSQMTDHIITFVHALAWFVVLQFVLALICGVPRRTDLESLSDQDDPALERTERRVKTLGILLGHITGFAFILAFSLLKRHLEWCPPLVLSLSGVAWLAIFALGQVTNLVRDYVARYGDDSKDEYEKLWDEVCAETEDDIVGLAVSYSFVNGMRFIISGVLPDPEGHEPPGRMESHPPQQSGQLVILSMSTLLLQAVRLFLPRIMNTRFNSQSKNVIGMTFAWSFFYAMNWWMSYQLFRHEHGMLKDVVLALAVTGAALLMMFLLIYLENLEETSGDVDAMLRACTTTIGILIGFAWEKAFDQAVLDISESVHLPGVLEKHIAPPVIKLFLAVVLTMVVAPSWYRHVYPTIYRYEKEERLEQEELEKQRQEKSSLESDSEDSSSGKE